MDSTQKSIQDNDFRAKSFGELVALVEVWGHQKGILGKSTSMAQSLKTGEELNELQKAILSRNIPEIRDGLGDVLVTLILVAKLEEVSLVECLEEVYEIISNRDGAMNDGMFVKSN